MSEKFPDFSEKKAERIPSPDEVLALFKREIGNTKFEERLKLEDEQGLYLWRIELSQKDGDGNTIEYEYERKGDYRVRGLPGGSPKETAIHVSFFDGNGEPISGYAVCKLIDGDWKNIGRYDGK
jgi:hypothetical protein